MKTHTPARAVSRLDRSDYQTPDGLAFFWTKDGLWHVAKRCPEIVDGLRRDEDSPDCSEPVRA